MNDLLKRLRNPYCNYTDMEVQRQMAANAIEALQAEVDDIKQVQFPRKLDAVAKGWKKQIAARDLVIKQMALAMSGLAAILDNDEWKIIEKTIALQPSTEALDAYVTEKVAKQAAVLRVAKEALVANIVGTSGRTPMAHEAIRQINELGI